MIYLISDKSGQMITAELRVTDRQHNAPRDPEDTVTPFTGPAPARMQGETLS
ncbi:hypothetical protein GCM10010193_01570 [Kitasatospora atroaurantiaca]